MLFSAGAGSDEGGKRSRASTETLSGKAKLSMTPLSARVCFDGPSSSLST